MSRIKAALSATVNGVMITIKQESAGLLGHKVAKKSEHYLERSDVQ